MKKTVIAIAFALALAGALTQTNFMNALPASVTINNSGLPIPPCGPQDTNPCPPQ